jgi:hypothetical protein
MLDAGAPSIVGDTEFGRDGVRLMVTWSEKGQQRTAVYWVTRGEMQQFAEQAGRPNAGASNTEQLFRLFETQVRQRVLDKHAEKQAAPTALTSGKS